MNSADTVFKALIEKVVEAGHVITPLKLQKLAYYCQGYAVGIFGEACFDAPIEAWDHGPVVRAEYFKYKTFGESAISVVSKGAYDDLFPLAKKVVDLVVDKYGHCDAWMLRNQTHRESPWMDVYAAGESNVISVDKIGSFFTPLVKTEVDEECARLMSAMEDNDIVQVPMSIGSEDEFLRWLHS